MATIKSYTDLQQSRKLAEILPLESADMHTEALDDEGDMVFIVADGLGDKTKSNYGSPVWSLAALLGVLPEYNLQMTDWGNGKIEIKIVVSTDKNNYASKNYDNIVDACYEMILKLHELNLL